MCFLLCLSHPLGRMSDPGEELLNKWVQRGGQPKHSRVGLGIGIIIMVFVDPACYSHALPCGPTSLWSLIVLHFLADLLPSPASDSPSFIPAGQCLEDARGILSMT